MTTQYFFNVRTGNVRRGASESRIASRWIFFDEIMRVLIVGVADKRFDRQMRAVLETFFD